MIASDITEPSRTQISSPDETPALPLGHPSDAETDVQILREVPQRFAVNDEGSANWLVRRIMAAREYGRKVKDWAEQERRRAEREEQTLLYLYGRQAEQWAQQEIVRLNGKRKSLVLPGGTVGFRRAPAKLVVDDEKVVILWAKENCPQSVVVVERLAKVILDTYVHETGHTPEDGVHVEPATDKFYIR